MRATSLLLFGLVLTLAAGTCGHPSRTCPPQRPFARRPPTQAPTGPATVAAVAAAGARYEVCAPAAYVLTREGQRELTNRELLTVQDGLFNGLPGRASAGVGGVRCPRSSSPGAIGVHLEIREHSATPVEIAEKLAALAPEGAIARVQVTIISAPGPRCAPDDLACEPLPYGAACVEKTDYDPQGKRTIVRAGGGTDAPCAHDGECTIGGCGNECVPTSDIPLPGTCQLYTRWQNVYCGCVQNACAWFTTK